MRWIAAAIGLVLLASATPAIGSFHETIGVVPDRIYVLAMQGSSFNGLHAPDAPLLEAFVGERARFALAATEAHTFHLHGHPWVANGLIVDTFLVNGGATHVFDVTAGSVDGQAGDWMYHCHIEDHMAEGMWGIFRVYPFATDVQKVERTLTVTLERLGEPVEGAHLALAVDGAPLDAHVVEQPGGVYLVHADLPADGAVSVTATHALGTSVGRLALGAAPVPALTVTATHGHP